MFSPFMILLKKLFKCFSLLSLFMVHIINFILLLPVYFIGVGLSALCAALGKKEVLPLKRKSEATYWEEYPPKTKKKEEYYRMF